MSKHARILIAEDDVPFANVEAYNLKSKGFDVTVAYDGLEALAYAHQSQFDLVLIAVRQIEMGIRMGRVPRQDVFVPLRRAPIVATLLEIVPVRDCLVSVQLRPGSSPLVHPLA